MLLQFDVYSHHYQLQLSQLCGESPGMQGSSNPHKLQTVERVRVAIPTSQTIRCPIMALNLNRGWQSHSALQTAESLLLRGSRLRALAVSSEFLLCTGRLPFSPQFEIGTFRLRALFLCQLRLCSSAHADCSW